MRTPSMVASGEKRSQRAVLTLDGRALLQDRAAWLRDEQIPALRAAVFDSHPRDWWVHQDLDRAEEDLRRLERTLHVAATVPVAKSDVSIVEFGDLVAVEFCDPVAGGPRVERFRLVHPIEAPLERDRISMDSALAQALIGARVGQTVEVPGPAGTHRVRVLSAVRPTLPPGAIGGVRAHARTLVGQDLIPASRAGGRRAPRYAG